MTTGQASQSIRSHESEPNRGEAGIDRGAAIIKWVAFGVLLPLFPILARFIGGTLLTSGLHLNPIELFGDGELLVITTVIAAAGIGEIIFSEVAFSRLPADRKRRRCEAVAIALALIIILGSVLIYALGAVDVPGFPALCPDLIATLKNSVVFWSYTMFIASMLVGFLCIYLSTAKSAKDAANGLHQG